MNDSQILELYFRRSERAITETAARYGPYCHTIAYNILGSPQDSEECVNDTYLTAWNQIPPQRPRRFSAYLARITRNLSIDRLRSLHAAKRGGGQLELAIEELDRTMGPCQDPEAEVIQSELTAQINAFLRLLPDTERQVFVCRYFYLDSIPDIARRFGFTASKVKSMLHRTRNKLKTYLIEQGGYDL